MSDTTGDAQPATRRPMRMAIPLLMFLGLAGLFLFALFGGDPSKLPSALIGKQVPEFDLPALDGLVADGKPVPGFSHLDLAKGDVTIVNIWASWCVPCRNEHPFLMKLAARGGAKLYGINYKNKAAAARRFLGQLGNPFAAVGVDESGATALDWGVYGVPETFVVSGSGRIVHKRVGPIDDSVIATEILPAITRAREAK